jgi:hypothetical protein
VLFASARSFVEPDAANQTALRDLVAFAASGNAHSQLLLVGHTDTAGSPSPNEPLSEHRAEAVHALLTGGTAAWERLFTVERWSTPELTHMVVRTGEASASDPAAVAAAVARYQGAANAAARAGLYQCYFDALLGRTGPLPIKFVTHTPPHFGCGEQHPLRGPIANPSRDPALPAITGDFPPNRRVEAFFFKSVPQSLPMSCVDYRGWTLACPLRTPAPPIVGSSQITMPLTPEQIEDALADLPASFPTLCSLEKFPNKSVEGRDIHFVKIANGTGPDRPRVLFLGGVHARESAPPDALIRFAQNLLASHDSGTDIVFGPMSCTPLPAGPAVSYPQFTIFASTVATIVDNVDLYIAPLVNPDGRLFDQLNPPVDPADGGWRKNRRPHVGSTRVGVDLNRNHNIAWKFEDYYDMVLYRARYVDEPASVNEADDTYRGPLVASEPETRNVQWIVDTKRINYFVDVHQFGRKVLTAWGIEDNGDEPTMTFSAAAWTGKRDGLRSGDPALPPGPDYREFVSNVSPHFVADGLGRAGTAMHDAILRSAGVCPSSTAPDPKRDHSTYDVIQSAWLYHPLDGGPVTGTTDDYAFSRQFDDPSRAPVFTFTLETGHEEEQGFHPNYSSPPGHYAKIEREIHAALIELCTIAANGP